MTISSPGIYDLTPEEYHADPCEQPSLSSSGIKRLLSSSPASFASWHPRLTRWPDRVRDTTDAQDIGAIAHCVVLGKGTRYIVGDPSDHLTEKGQKAQTWAAKSAAQWKADREADGFTVITRERSARAETAAQAMKDLIAREYGDWPLGESEQTVIWRGETTSDGPIWCRAMLDHLSRKHLLILDPKFTDLPIDDRSIQRKAATEQWHIQQSFYTEGVETLAPNTRGRWSFRFVVAELNPPYQVRFVDLPESWIAVARGRIDRAAGTFAQCLKNNEWPPLAKTCAPQPPDWLMKEYESEEVLSDASQF
jgi:hypothetical protein